MIRVAILLLIVAGLVIFALQNLAPIALVILGMRITLPLAAWVLGAMAAGAVTTLLLSGFSSLSRSAAVRRSTQPGPTRSPWSSASARDSGVNPSRSRKAADVKASEGRRSNDDWETNAGDEWDEWAQPQESASRRAASSTPKTEIRDSADESWVNWDGYEEPRPRRSPWSVGDEPRPSRSSSVEPEDRLPHDRVRQSPVDPPVQPQRTDFEARQSPTTQQQTGSVYSYSYREPQEPPARKPSETRKTSEIYDAEFRVLIPPYTPVPPAPEPTPTPPPVAEDDDDDWGLDDDLEEKPKP